MADYHVKNLSEIDFVEVNPADDQFILPSGDTYCFSDHICDFCRSGGTVFEKVNGDKKYYCVLCQNQLMWRQFKNDFLPPTADTVNFLLPATWSAGKLNEWFEQYKERRLEQEKVREHILKYGKE